MAQAGQGPVAFSLSVRPTSPFGGTKFSTSQVAGDGDDGPCPWVLKLLLDGVEELVHVFDAEGLAWGTRDKQVQLIKATTRMWGINVV